MIIQFQPWHMELIRLSKGDREALEQYRREFDVLGKAELTRTIVSDTPEKTEILGVVGAIAVTDQICEVFVVPAEPHRQHVVEFARSVEDILTRIRRQFATIQAVGEDTPRLNRWFEWLGFRRAGYASRGLTMHLWEMKGA